MFRALTAALLFVFVLSTPSQVAGRPPQTAPASPAPVPPAKRGPSGPAKDAQPGGGSGKVWVNLNSSTYHCEGDRYYGKTSNGRYMTESAARSAGAKAAGGKLCSAAR